MRTRISEEQNTLLLHHCCGVDIAAIGGSRSAARIRCANSLRTTTKINRLSEPTTSETHRKKSNSCESEASILDEHLVDVRVYCEYMYFMHFVYWLFAAPTAIDNHKRNKRERVFDGQRNAAICCAKATTVMRRLKTF